MKTHLLKLESSVKNGVGGPEVGIIDLIYTFLLQELNLDIYNYIHIHQIGDDLNEIIFKERRSVYINIRYPIHKDFNQKNSSEKNLIRLNVVHQALLRLAEQDKRIDKKFLEIIRNRIIDQDFNFHFILKEASNKKLLGVIGKVIICPSISDFKFYAEICKDGLRICKLLIYKGATVPLYFIELFSICKWETKNQLLISGKRSEIDIRINIDDCKLSYINKNNLGNEAPFLNYLKQMLIRTKHCKIIFIL